MYIYFLDSAQEFLSLNFQMEKKAGKNPFLSMIFPSENKIAQEQSILHSEDKIVQEQ